MTGLDRRRVLRDLGGAAVCLATAGTGTWLWRRDTGDPPRLAALSSPGGPVRWTAPVPEGSLFAYGPVDGGRLFLRGSEAVFCLDTATGRRLWMAPLDDTSVLGGRFVTGHGAVWARSNSALAGFDSGTGAVRWSKQRRTSAPRPMAAVGTDLVFDCGDDNGAGAGAVHAYEPTGGALRWLWRAEGALWGGPVLDANTVYVTGTRGREGVVYALDARSGTRRWVTPLGRLPSAQSPSSLVLGGGTAYVWVDEGSLYAVDAATGALRWRVAVGKTANAPVVAGDTVYLGTAGTVLHAYSTRDGTRRWTFTPDEPAADPRFTDLFFVPVVHDGLVHIRSDKVLYTLDARDGRPRWRRPVSISPTRPFLAMGNLYAVTGTQEVTVFDPADGTVLQRLDLQAFGAERPAVGLDDGGAVYLLVEGGVVAVRPPARRGG